MQYECTCDDCGNVTHVKKNNEVSISDFRSDALERIKAAMDGDHGNNQHMIANIGVDVVERLLQKNADYGSSVFKPPTLCPNADARTGILTRMSDKIERLQNLLASNKPEVVDESIDDTMFDLAGYAILYLTAEWVE